MSPQRQSTPSSHSTTSGTRRNSKLSAAVSTAAIPAVVLSSLALVQPAQASPTLPAPRALPQALAQAVAAVGPFQSSRIPAALVAASLPSALAPMTRRAPSSHTVKSGETISAIARQYGLNTRDLLKLNGLGVRTIIFPGQKIKLGGGAQAPQEQDAGKQDSRSQASPSRSGSATYTVKSGDTISAIAARHGLSTHHVLDLNGLSARSVIYPGQKIRVSGNASPDADKQSSSRPAPKPAAKTPGKQGSSDGKTYTVKSGDTISAIAARHGLSTSKVLNLNNLSSRSTIYPGQKIELSPSGRVSTQANDTTVIKTDKSKPKSSPGSYTVKTGDTLGAIASRHGVKLSSLLQANNLKLSSVIYPGNKLSIPGGNGSSPAADQDKAPKDLVSSTFLHYTYPKHVVAKANDNMAALLKAPAPSAAQIQDIIVQTAKKMGVPPSLALAHAYQESGFNHQAVSPANAIGTMQVIPSSGEWASQLVGRQLNLLDPRDNITAGVAIISALLRTSDSTDKAIGSYYQGQWSVNKHGLYDDTKKYVKSVKAHQKRFR